MAGIEKRNDTGADDNHEFAHRSKARGLRIYPAAEAAIRELMEGTVGTAANREGVDHSVAPGSVVDPVLEEEILLLQRNPAGSFDGVPEVSISL